MSVYFSFFCGASDNFRGMASSVFFFLQSSLFLIVAFHFRIWSKPTASLQTASILSSISGYAHRPSSSETSSHYFFFLGGGAEGV